MCSARQGKNNNKVKLTVTYDLDWQKISSGRRYDSSSGHAFIIGGRSKGIIGMVLYSRSTGSVTLQKREEMKQKNMIAQRTPRKAQKIWRLLLY